MRNNKTDNIDDDDDDNNNMNYLKECKDLVWKCTVVGHPWYYSHIMESVVSLSCGRLLRLD